MRIIDKPTGAAVAGRLHVVLVILSLVATANCGESSTAVPTTAPAATSLSGTWLGLETDSVAGTGNLRATISQSGSTLSGTYSLTFTDPSFDGSGTLSGTVTGLAISMTATPIAASLCPSLDTAALNAALTQITGTYAPVSGCNLTGQKGEFSITKQ